MTRSYSTMVAKRDEAWWSKKIRAELSNLGLISFTSFENCGVPFVPDLYATSRHRSPFWIELKAITTPKCEIPFRKGQPSWIHTHARNGGTTRIVVGIERPLSVVVFWDDDVHALVGKKVCEMGHFKTADIPISGPGCWLELLESLLAQPG